MTAPPNWCIPYAMECISHRWSPQLGDPTIFGWATVALYIVAAAFCLVRARDAFATIDFDSDRPAKRWRVFWLGAAIILAALAINKQLDLQSLLTAAGRCAAQAQGWYQARDLVQLGFVGSVIAVGAAAAALSGWYFRSVIADVKLAAAGFFLLIIFVFVRATSFHVVDGLIDAQILGLRVNWILEMGALLMIIWGARKKSKPRAG